jgi:hypothetical protein
LIGAYFLSNPVLDLHQQLKDKGLSLVAHIWRIDWEPTVW